MTDLFKVRIERSLLKSAEEVTEKNGATPGDVVRQMFAQKVKRQAIPFPVSAKDPSDGLLDKDQRNRELRELDDSEGW